MSAPNVVEICAGAGGQALGLERAGFEHELAVELDSQACDTLRENRSAWKVAEGDVADINVWNPANYRGIDLLAGGVPCPPFTIAGKQLGAADERDLFAWAIELCGVIQPKALLLENVKGLSMNRFAGYRQQVLERLADLGYLAHWRLLNCSDYGVPQLRPRFVLVALQPDYFPYFRWPEPKRVRLTVGKKLHRLMAADGWQGADQWARMANDIAPTIVGGSKKHGGADLGPTRAKKAWAELGVNAHVLADAPPPSDAPIVGPETPVKEMPKLTTEMVARIQGWDDRKFRWKFTGRKTSVYRQIGNAFPPPVAAALGEAIRDALLQRAAKQDIIEEIPPARDEIYAILSDSSYRTVHEIAAHLGRAIEPPELERRLSHLGRDFEIEIEMKQGAPAYRLGRFKAFKGQSDHFRHEAFRSNVTTIS